MSANIDICDHCRTNPDIYFKCGDHDFNLCFDEPTVVSLEDLANEDYCDCLSFKVQGYDDVFTRVEKNTNNELEVEIDSSIEYNTYYVITIEVLCSCKDLSDFVNLHICVGEPYSCNDPQQQFDCSRFIEQYA